MAQPPRDPALAETLHAVETVSVPAMAATLASPVPDGDGGLAATQASISGAPTGPFTATQANGQAGSLDRYTVGAVLGRGGMGEVLSADDHNLDRRVALKRMRGRRSGADVVRFLREAKIQARLDHPAIVPIYEIGRDASGAPFFSMKQLAGQTLDDVLRQAGSAGEHGKLLRKFIDICLAIDFAHQRGVVHRDLKPANIMLGDFGEVYVLDWGIARIVDDDDPLAGGLDVVTVDGDAAEGQATPLTAAGALVGTPGFMAPEQVRGEVATTACDVYALGCMLFELLVGEPLHPRGPAALAHTLDGADRDPLQRAPLREIPPELAAVCVAATAPVATERPAVRAIAENLQQFLDGDRDARTRRDLAAQMVTEARAHLAEGSGSARAAAMQKAGRAISLDPGSTDATAVIAALLQPRVGELPSEVKASIEQLEQTAIQTQMRGALFACFAYLLVLPVLLWQGVRDWAWFAALAATASMQGLLSMYFLRRPTARPVWVPLIINSVLVALSARLFGPWLLMPALAVGIMSGLTAFPTLTDRPWLVTSGVLMGGFTPVVLEAFGLLSPTWSVVAGGVWSHSGVLALSGTTTIVLAVVFNVCILLITGVYARGIARQRRGAVEALEYQSWHLRQMLPNVASANGGVQRSAGIVCKK
jgi:serine/threonine-protein kinase